MGTNGFNKEKYSKNGIIGQLFNFQKKRLQKKLKEGSRLWKRAEKEPDEGSYSKTGTEKNTGEGFWLKRRNQEPNRVWKSSIA